MTDKYILDDEGNPVPEDDLTKWGEWFESIGDGRRVERTCIGDVEISTVFLGLDHGYGSGPPMLYETMIFGGEHDSYQERCSTKEQAQAMHKRAVERVQA